MPEVYDESEHCKEVYAHFGLAYYESGVVETGLAIVLLYAEFLAGWKRKILQHGRAVFDRKTYEAEFDAFLKNQHGQTLGNLLKRLDRAVGIPAGLMEAIKEGKALRDFLAHHYFREHAVDFVTRLGRDRMIAELTAMQEKFRNLDLRVQQLGEPVKQELGIHEKMLKPFMEEFIRKAYAGELS